MQAEKTAKAPEPGPTDGEQATELQAMEAQWLQVQCSMIKDALSARIICLELEKKRLSSVATWPENKVFDTKLPQNLLSCLRTQKHQIHCLGDNTDELCFPLFNTRFYRYTLVLTMAHRSELMQRSVLNMLQVGRQWFRFALNHPEPKASLSHMSMWDAASRCLEHSELSAACSTLVASLASQLRCARVSYGACRSGQIDIRAISHTASFNKKTESLQLLSDAMREAVDQDSVLITPAQEVSKHEVTAHQRLATNSSSGAICTIPVAVNGQIIAAITLERSLEKPFEDGEVNYLERLTSILASHLYTLQELSSSRLWKARRVCAETVRQLITRGHMALKLKVAALVLLVAFLAFADGNYRISSPAIIEGRVQRSIVAPMDGFLASAEARAGDPVQQGQLIGQLEDKDLKLEQLAISSEQQELLGAYREAMAEHDNAEVSVLNAKIEQANARMQLVNAQLRRTRLLAPFDGVIIEGDLSQALGAPVSKGDVLFKVAPLSDYRIILQVDESDIANITPGQSGRVVLTSLPGEPIDITVKKITSVSTAEDQRNYFRVEAHPNVHSPKFRPGMEGAGKVTIGERRLCWIWTHKLWDWLRLKVWSWLP